MLDHKSVFTPVYCFVKRLVYLAGMYAWMYQVNKTLEILLWLKIPFILHSI